MNTSQSKTSNIPAKLNPSSVIAVVDSREQRPLNLEPLQIVTETLCTGDYSVRGLEHVVRIERKSLDDLLGCVGSQRERFDREVQRLLSFPVRILVVESTWAELEAGSFKHSKVTSESVIGSLLGWQASGLAVHMCEDHMRSGRHVARLLFTVARRRYQELRNLLEAVT